MTQSLLQEPVQSYEDSNGKPLNGGQLFSYAAGTLTPKATYQDAAGSTPNTNPIILNERGEAVVYGTGNYRMILKNSVGATIWDRDNISAAGYNGTDLSTIFASQVNRVVDSIAALRLLDKTKYTRAFVTGYYAAGDGGGGNYWYDSSDTTSVDNGGSIIVASDSARWKLLATQYSVLQFGAKGDGVTNDVPAISNAHTASGSRKVFYPTKTYLLSTDVNAATGARALFQAGVAFSGSGKLKNVLAEFELGQATATAASKMQIDWLWEHSDVKKAPDVAYLWPQKTYTFAAFNKTFGASDGGAGSPCFGTMSYAVNNGSPAEVCGSLSIGSLITNGSIFGQNVISTADPAINAKMFGTEIDYEPSIGTVVDPTGVGLNLVGFNVALPRAMVIGTIGGGAWSDGIQFLNGFAITANCLAAQATLSANTFIDASAGTFVNGSIVLGNGFSKRIFMKTSGGGEAGSYWADSGGNMNLTLNSAAFLVSGSNTTEGQTISVVRDSGGVASLQVFVARGSAPNAANAAMKVNGQSVTSRSINAGGTINASGADYAEYEVKRDDCGAVQKGQIIGFDADGKVTDQFSLAVSFGIKSTAPNLVGGDTWGTSMPEKPTPPDAPQKPAEPIKVETVMPAYKDQAQAEYDEALAKFETDSAAYEQAHVRYQNELSAHAIALSAWESQLESLRAKVDRIAYCGKVPVNVIGARVGQHVVPVSGPDGSITAVLVDDAAITFEQYRAAVGRVRCILDDGRAEVVVKPI